jgi:hypothetical protein
MSRAHKPAATCTGCAARYDSFSLDFGYILGRRQGFPRRMSTLCVAPACSPKVHVCSCHARIVYMRQQLLLLIGCNEHVLVMRDTYRKQSNGSLSRKQICSLVWLCSIRMRTFRTQASQPACQSRRLTSLSLPIALDDNCIGHRIGMS